MMKDLLIRFIGEYQPVVDSKGHILNGIARLDVPWIASASLLCLVIYCLFRLVGVLIAK